MKDQEVLKLLRRIDYGYKPTEKEKEELAGIETITWKRVKDIPDCIDILSGLRELDISGDIVKESNLMDIPESIGSLTSLLSLNLSYTELSTLPDSTGNLTSLQRLDLSSTKLSTLPESIGNLTSLQSLDLSSTKLSTLPEGIWKLTSLQSLFLSDTQINTLPESIGNLTSLQSLNLSFTKLSTLPESIWNLTSLQSLNLNYTKLSTLPESIGNLTSLWRLDLSHTQISTLPESIGNLTSLWRLNLSSTKLSTLPESIWKLMSLQILDLRSTQLSTLPENIVKLTSLQNLYLSHTQLSTLPENIVKLTNLQSLFLSDTQISMLPENIVKLTSLQSLDLSNMQISTLPESIGNLTNLKYLYLERLTLAELPESLLHLNLEYKTDEFGFRNDGFGIYIHGLKLQNQPIEIFGQSRDLIIEYYESIKSQSTSLINECKVVFLGDGGAGKSLAIYRLLNNGKKVSEFRSDGKRETVWGKIRKIINPSVSEFDGETTPGIAISTEKSVINGEEIRINYWDFGGQEILHSMHRMFLTQRTIYVVLVNARDNTQDERARYWVNNIKSFANGAPILIVINQMDQNPSASINEKSLRAFYPNILPKVIKMSALKDSPETFNQQLRDEIYKGIDGMDSVHSVIPKTWKDLMDIVRGMTGNYMMMDKFEALCVENDVQNYKKYQGDLIDWFQDIGVSFCYRKDRSLEDYMLLEPKWIVNAIYTILFNGRQVSQNGILLKNDLYAILKDDTITVRGTRQKIKRVLPNLRYKGIEVTYVLGVIRRFKLAYELNEDSLFIPMLCDRDERISVKDSIGEDSRHIIFKYEYLPENVIHRVIVDMRQDLDYENVWFSGAVFCNRSGFKAYVKTEDKSLHIYAKSGDLLYTTNEYLNRFRDSVNSINTELGLSAEEYVTLSLDNVEDEFLYDELVGSLKTGGSQIYSVAHKKQINIKQILDLYNYSTDVSLEGVVNQMLSVLGEMSEQCVDLQKRGEVELTSDFQRAIAPVLNEKYGLQVAREYTMGRAKEKIGETDLYFFTYKDGIKKEQYILENKVIDNFSNQYQQLMGYLNPNFSAGFTLSINKKKGWEEAFDYICEKLNELKKAGGDFAPISINRCEGESGTSYIRSEHIVPENGLKMPVYHLVLQLSDGDRHRAAIKARE